MPISIEYHLNKINYFLRAFSECKEDLLAAREGRSPHYNLDFGLLVPVLFDRRATGSKEFLSTLKGGMSKVLSQPPPVGHHDLVVSGATLIEFYDQITHMVVDIEKRVPNTLKKLTAIKEMEIFDLVQSSKKIRKDLEFLVEDSVGKLVNAPINRFIRLLDEGVVRGIGDVVERNELKKIPQKELYETLLQEHRGRRLSRERGRSQEDSLFHYKMDAANNCLTIAIRELNLANAPFVTPTPLNLQQCDSGDHHSGRLDRIPLMMLNLSEMKSSGVIRDEVEFINHAIEESYSVSQELLKYEIHSGFDNLPHYTQLRVARYYTDIPGLLLQFNAPRESGNKRNLEDDVVQIMERLSDEKKMREHLSDVVAEAKEAAQILELHGDAFDISYLEQFDFRDDPVIGRIRGTLGLKLGKI